MRQVRVSIPELAVIAGTRAILGIGIGLLWSAHVPSGRRRTIGLTLLGIGVLSTIPLALQVLPKRRALDERSDRPLAPLFEEEAPLEPIEP
jgi:hypothetical protein